MARRRRRKGRRPVVEASDLAWAFVRRHVPSDEVRLIRVQAAWDGVATVRVAARTWPIRIDGSELQVAVQDNQWLHELAYLRQDLVTRLRERVPLARIESIRLKLGKVPERRGETDTEQPARPSAILSEDPPDDTMQTLREIDDSELREAAAAARLTLGRKR
jgi:predicted nucleic acid-binding Zn ribbon protein